MRQSLNLLGWLACVVYSTIPSFWLMIHPFADRWRGWHRSPYRLFIPTWVAMWALAAAITWRWRHVALYSSWWSWSAAAALFATGIWLYARSARQFTASQLSGLPEVRRMHRDRRLVTSGIRARVRHPVYLAHLCEMLAWSMGTGLAVCFALTAFAITTGAIMVHLEDAELERRFGDDFREYRRSVPAILPARKPDSSRPL